ncbi:MAG: hypothetical protein AB7O97_10090 [Planctomycetota bacterium]
MADTLIGRRPVRASTQTFGRTRCQHARVARHCGRGLAVAGLAFASLTLAGCGGGGGGIGAVGATPGTGTVTLQRLEFGRLADIYGLRTTPEGQIVELFQRDVMIGRDIQDERVPGTVTEGRADSEISYDFIGNDPDTLQSRVLIPREIGSTQFQTLLAAIDDEMSQVAPLAFGQVSSSSTYSVVPRNAVLRLRFSGDLSVADDFFVVRDADGRVIGQRNTEAVQLLQIGGDPSQSGNFVPIPIRVVVGSDNLILDPVLLGTEGLQYATSNNASGMPASPDSFGANIRVALALEGPLAIPGLRAGLLSGLNNAGRNSIIRDFRSGNDADDSADISRGFIRDPEPPRLVGELPFYLERVDPVNAVTVQVTVFKGGVNHEIDRGDVVRFVLDSSGVPFGAGEVVVDPADDRGDPSAQHVRLRVRNVAGLESIDPTNRPDFPSTGTAAEVEDWLRINAPRAVLVTEFQGGRVDTASGDVILQSDDPRYFGLFSPNPQPRADGSPSDPNENVSPFAGAVVRFTKPVDLGSVRWADSLFFATRNLTDQDAIDEFIQNRPFLAPGTTQVARGMARSSFSEGKFRTPHLVASRVLDEDGSQTTLRLQPLQGFYLDETMRADGMPEYFLHLLTGDDGIRDLAGNSVDLQTNDPNRARGLVIPFTLDPRFEDNLAVYVVRRFDGNDEDENPSYYLPEEVQGDGTTPNALALPLEDVFGALSRVDGRIEGRPTTRLRTVADDINQAPVDPQESILRWCPLNAAGEEQIASNTATAPFGQGIQNPFNPYGCRLQTVWREIDLSLSRTDPFDFNLDIERMFWAPATTAIIEFDEFDSVELRLGHSEFRPEPCVGNFGALPTFPDSGLTTNFFNNYVRNIRANSTATDVESRPREHLAFTSTPTNMQIDSQSAVLERNGQNRYLPLPPMRRPYFVYRDETLVEQGCNNRVGSDSINGRQSFEPWILSPWNNGVGRRAVQTNTPENPIAFTNGFWNSGNNYQLRVSGTPQLDTATEGLVGNVALPLLADFLVQCDSPDLPSGNGYVAFGTVGWQISVALQSSPVPNFRVYTAGRPVFPGQQPLCRDPSQSPTALGGFAPPPPLGVGGTTRAGDNSFYWIMIDFLKRASVATSGFVDLYNPHRVPNGFADSRLGPYFTDPITGTLQVPATRRPRFTYEFEPPVQPAGTSVVAQFRAASAVADTPWYWDEWVRENNSPDSPYSGLSEADLRPTPQNFPLDPFKACDAHIRKFDDRSLAVSGNVARNWWSYFYNNTVTNYVLDPNDLLNTNFLSQYSGPNDGFTPDKVRYVNWRFLMSNNIDASPPVAPTVDTFAMSYRFERVQ